jgi:hypothetical protein
MRHDKLSSPMNPPYPSPDPKGDRRDIHDVNPATNLNVAHDKGRDTMSLDFVEETDAHSGSRIGRTADVVPDILSTAMGGQRRSATAEYESEPSIHRTQDNDIRERAERMASTVPYDPFKRTEGRE